MPDEEPLDHLVWYTGHYSGDCVVWWRPDGHGYTTDLTQAGRYTKTRAKEIEKLRGQEVAVPVAVAEMACVKHVVADRLRDGLEKLGLPIRPPQQSSVPKPKAKPR